MFQYILFTFLRNLWMDNSENRFYTEATYNKMKFREI